MSLAVTGAAWAPLGASALAAAALGWRWTRDQRDARRWRNALLDDCVGEFDDARLSIDRADLPRLDASAGALAVSISLVLDTTALRKRPALWMVLDARARLGVRAVLDAIARADGHEFHLDADATPYRLAAPAGWPDHVIVRGSRDVELQPGFVDAARRWFAQPASKALTVAPGGLRLVRLVAEARAAEYRLLRQSRFDLRRIDPQVVRALAADAAALSRSLPPS
jgi:hypothetical protein